MYCGACADGTPGCGFEFNGIPVCFAHTREMVTKCGDEAEWKDIDRVWQGIVNPAVKCPSCGDVDVSIGHEYDFACGKLNCGYVWNHKQNTG